MKQSVESKIHDVYSKVLKLMKYRNDTMYQSLTDLEISQIENEQATTDLEIAVAELQTA